MVWLQQAVLVSQGVNWATIPRPAWSLADSEKLPARQALGCWSRG